MSEWSVESIIKPEPWVRDAACVEVAPDAFFPARPGDPAHAARAICRRCPVAMECLEYAMRTNQREGIWGNTSPRERAAIRRRNR